MVIMVLAVILYILVCAWCFCAGYLCCDKFNSKTFEDGMKAFDDALQSLDEAQDLLRQADDRYSEAAHVVTFPDKDKSITHWYGCGACGKAVNPGDKFCPECGRELKWDA